MPQIPRVSQVPIIEPMYTNGVMNPTWVRFFEKLASMLNAGDLAERKLWDKYMAAYEEALSKTSTDYAPWYIVPANRNWYRNLVISEVLVKTLEDLHMAYPEPQAELEKIVIE